MNKTSEIYFIDKIIKFLILLAIFQFLEQVHGAKITCENTYNVKWNSVNETVKTCAMKHTTAILEDDVGISSVSGSVQGLTFTKNKKVFFLPVNVAESFPNLTAYSGTETSIKDVAKKNFKGLRKLRSLDLSDNQIDLVQTDTFEDLVNLEILFLCKNFYFFLERFLFFFFI